MYGVVTCLILSIFVSIADAGLYNRSDSVYILDNINFHKSLLNSETAWVIEFYNTWCGHCIHFAPTWKKFGQDVKDWSHTVKVGVIDCANEANIDICREYEIMGYPTVRLFSSGTVKDYFGESMSARTVQGMRNSLVEFISAKQELGNSSKTWVNLQSYTGSFNKILDSTDRGKGFIIMENKDSFSAREVILDLGRDKSVYIRRHVADNAGLRSHNVNTTIGLVIVNKKGDVVIKDVSLPSRSKLRRMISPRRKETNIQKPESVVNEPSTSPKNSEDEIEGAGDGGSSVSLFVAPKPILSSKDVVYMVDIENALSYALQHEVSIKKVINGDKLIALFNFLNAAVLYVPCRPEVKNFLINLRDYVDDKNSITGPEFTEALNRYNTSDSVLPHQQEWIRCLGSKETFRGYPCGLWTTFHAMTVHSHDQTVGITVLDSIHGYVKHFFGCSHCSKHFQEMYKNLSGASVTTRDGSIRWLWKAHNQVNERLKGDLSEDPAHPKKLYPTKEMCPKCWHNDEFVIDAVTDYLKVIFSKYNISLKGVGTISEIVMNKQARVQQLINSKKKIESLSDLQSRNVYDVQSASASWGFTPTDMHLCVTLYVVSTILFISVYIFIVIKRKNKRNKFMQAHKNAEREEE